MVMSAEKSKRNKSAVRSRRAFTRPYDWALRQLRIDSAHQVTRGDPGVVVAVIDLGYHHHPDLDGRLWRHPRPKRGEVHGWDFVEDDASLEGGPPPVDTPDAVRYYRGHHVFVAGEVGAVAPHCPIMIVRVGYGAPRSWWRGIRYAVDNGARVLVMPHGYLTAERVGRASLFSQGVDFTYPWDNPKIRAALDYAYKKGCFVVRGAADNRGRRAVAAMCALDTVFAVGSAKRQGEPADICCSADYVAAGAPGGQRHSGNDRDRIWGCGGDGDYIPFTGGCMAAGFAGGVAALVWSRFPRLRNAQLAQVLCNTARPAAGAEPDEDGWEPRLGYGILDAARAVALEPAQMVSDTRLVPSTVRIATRKGKRFLEALLKNHGALDAARAMVVVYNGDPLKPVEPGATEQAPAEPLQVRQIGHTVTRVRGLHQSPVRIELTETPGRAVWFETFCLDRNDAGLVHRTRAKT